MALTEQGNLFSLVKFYRAAIDAGVKPIIGADVLLRGDSDEDAPSRLALLCQNQAGYLNLSCLSSLIGSVNEMGVRRCRGSNSSSASLIVLAGGVNGYRTSDQLRQFS